MRHLSYETHCIRCARATKRKKKTEKMGMIESRIIIEKKMDFCDISIVFIQKLSHGHIRYIWLAWFTNLLDGSAQKIGYKLVPKNWLRIFYTGPWEGWKFRSFVEFSHFDNWRISFSFFTNVSFSVLYLHFVLDVEFVCACTLYLGKVVTFDCTFGFLRFV